MLSETFGYWENQQSADSNVIQFHLALKCTKDQSSHFCDYFLVSKCIFQHHDRGLTKFHSGSEQPLVCVVIRNSCYSTLKNNNKAYHVFGKYRTQSRGFLNYRLKCCSPKVIYFICQPNELNRKLRKQLRLVNQKSWGPRTTQAP